MMNFLQKLFAPNIKKLESRRVRGLIRALNHREWGIRIDAAESLGRLKEASAIEPLITALHDADRHRLDSLPWMSWKVSDAAATALGQIGAPAVEPLITALKKGGKKGGSEEAKALAGIGTPAVEPLITILKDGDNDVREMAAEILGKIGDARAVEPLYNALKDSDGFFMRETVGKALGKISWQPGRDEIAAQYWIEKNEWNKCAEIGAPAVEPLIITLQCWDRDVRQAAVKVLGQLGDARAVEPLITALQDQDEDVRRAAAAALGQLGDTRAVEPLCSVLKDSDKAVRWSAATALDQIGWQPGKDEIAAQYWIVKEAWDKEAWDKCVEIGAPAVEPLITALKDYSKVVRQAAATALVAMYRASCLNELSRRRILEMQTAITHPHDDNYKHHDSTSYNDCSHLDSNWHEDNRGVGVSFPV